MPTTNLTIELLGGVKLRRDGVLIDRLPSRRIAALLGYLALRPGWQSREEVAEAVWQDQEEGRATASLRNALSILRRLLEPRATINESAIEATRTHVRLLRDRCNCDVWSFHTAIESGDYPTAIHLYGGPLLPGIEDEWIEPPREELRTAFSLATSAEARKALEGGLAHRALEMARRWRESDPYEPESTRLIALAEAESGLVQTALDTLERYVSWYEKELGSPPMIDSKAIQEEIRTRAKQSQTPEPTASVESHVLPIYLTRFLGRETELTYISAWSQSRSFLLNIVGMGGMGKTRLAVEAARLLHSDWKVVFVPLVGVQSKGSAIQSISSALGLRDKDPLRSRWRTRFSAIWLGKEIVIC